MRDGPFEIEETRFGFVWGPVHVERIGVENGAAGFYLTDGQGNGIEVHVPVDGNGPCRAYIDWVQLRPPSLLRRALSRLAASRRQDPILGPDGSIR